MSPNLLPYSYSISNPNHLRSQQINFTQVDKAVSILTKLYQFMDILTKMNKLLTKKLIVSDFAVDIRLKYCFDMDNY